MSMVSMEHYVKERNSQMQKTQSRARPNPRSKGQTQGYKWNVSYVQAIKGTQKKSNAAKSHTKAN